MTLKLSIVEKKKRLEIIEISKDLIKKGLNRGSSGNSSIYINDKEVLITPSGINPEQLTIEKIVKINLEGKVIGQKLLPSSEWRFHCDIYRAHPDIKAIVHTHSTYATALASLRKSLPAQHYMVAVAGGHNVRCAKYAVFGSQELSNNALVALAARKVCLLANHGLIALGKNLTEASYIAQEIENLCQQYLICLQSGKPKILSQKQMNAVIKRFTTYSKR